MPITQPCMPVDVQPSRSLVILEFSEEILFPWNRLDKLLRLSGISRRVSVLGFCVSVKEKKESN